MSYRVHRMLGARSILCNVRNDSSTEGTSISLETVNLTSNIKFLNIWSSENKQRISRTVSSTLIYKHKFDSSAMHHLEISSVAS